MGDGDVQIASGGEPLEAEADGLVVDPPLIERAREHTHESLDSLSIHLEKTLEVIISLSLTHQILLTVISPTSLSCLRHFLPLGFVRFVTPKKYLL